MYDHIKEFLKDKKKITATTKIKTKSKKTRKKRKKIKETKKNKI